MKIKGWWLACLSALVVCPAWGQARIAVHPLDVRGLNPSDQDTLQAFFEVSIARVKGIRIAGSSRIEDALSRPEGNGCDLRDPCLQFLAQSTDSSYALHARIV